MIENEIIVSERNGRWAWHNPVVALFLTLLILTLLFADGFNSTSQAAGSGYGIVSTNCDGPVPDHGVEEEIFVWQDCNGGWHVRAGWLQTNGRTSLLGNISSTLGFDSFNGYDMEANDHLDSTNFEELNFDLSFTEPGYDGFDFAAPELSDICIDIKRSGAGASSIARYGPYRTPVAVAVNPRTLVACDPNAATGLTTPEQGATLGGSTAQFTFNAGGLNVIDWRIEIGSTVGGTEYYDSPAMGSATSTIVTGLPLDGSTVYVTLWYQLAGGSWTSISYSYTAATAPLVSGVSLSSAFPGACGYGSHQRDWSDASIVYVTNLSDTGAGSFRAALQQTGKRIVVFKTGGTINLNSQIFLNPSHSDVYVAGQTAPGDGIQILGPPVTANMGTVIKIRGDGTGPVDNMIFRYLSWRGDKPTQTSYGVKGDVMAIQGVTNFILDHNSLAFSRDEILSVNSLSCQYPHLGNGIQNDLSFTQNLVAEPFEPHTTMANFISARVLDDNLGTCPDVTPYSNGVPNGAPYPAFEGARDAFPSAVDFRRLTVHRNVFSSGTHRAPQVGSVDTSVTNNIAYGAEIGNLITAGSAELDHVGNMVLVHPDVINSPMYREMLQSRMVRTGGNRYDMEDPNVWFNKPPSVYIDGLYVETAPLTGAIIDPWDTDANGAPLYWEERDGSESNATIAPDIFSANWLCDGTDWRCNLNAERTTPLHRPNGAGNTAYACDVQTVPDSALITDILNKAGNYQAIDCAGDWYSRRQPTDTRQVNNVLNRTDSIGGARAIGVHNNNNYPQLASIAPNGIDEVGGYDVLSSGSACADGDGDGLPDAFESRYGLNMSANDALGDNDFDGFTNIEEWFNGTSPQ